MSCRKGKAIVLAALLGVTLTFAQTKPAVELEGAIAKEQVSGDLKAAIAAYQKIAEETSAPREVRAKALLHLAGCYEKLGQQESRKVYEQIIREYSDQPSAQFARTRLSALTKDDHPSQPPSMTQRKIELLGAGMGPWDTDGQRAVYWDQAAGQLIYTELARHSKRIIFQRPLEKPPLWFPSKDFTKVAILMDLAHGQPRTLAVVNIDGHGYREIAKLHVVPVFPECARLTWSWDGRYLLYRLPGPVGSKLVRISIASGRVTELVALPGSALAAVSGSCYGALFSPDGRSVAYKTISHPDTKPSQILVLSEGGEPRVVYEEPQGAFTLKLLDWTADGRYLMVVRAGGGKPALFLLPVATRNTASELVFLRYGSFEEGSTSAAGSLVYSSVKPGGDFRIYLTSFDSSGRIGSWKPLDLPLGNSDAAPRPNWSPNNDEIVYTATNEDAGQKDGDVHVYRLSSGEDRTIYHGDCQCRWAAQQPRLYCWDRAGLFSITSDSKEITRLSPAVPGAILMSVSRDDKRLYLFRIGSTGEPAWKLLSWEIETGGETVLAQSRTTTFDDNEGVLVTPDERWLYRFHSLGEPRKNLIEIRPMFGGDWKSLALLNKEITHVNFTLDGNWLVYNDVDSQGKHGLFRISISGDGAPERLGDFPPANNFGQLEISPDGRRVLATVGDEVHDELWLLENFVPVAGKK